MDVLTGLAVGSLVTGGALGLGANSAQRKAQRAQRQANALQEAKARRDMVRQSQVASESVIAAGAATGTMQASRTQQALGSIAQQTGEGLRTSYQLSALGQRASDYLAQASQMQMYSGLFTQVGTGIFNR